MSLSNTYDHEFIEYVRPRGDYFKCFWRPYLDGGAKNLALMAAPRFWRDDAGSYFRNCRANAEGDQWIFESLIGREAAACLDPSFHYVSAGEAEATMTLMREFHLRGGSLDFDTDLDYRGFAQINDCNLILFGSSRTSVLVRRLHEGERAFLSDQGVRFTGEQNDRYQDQSNSMLKKSPAERADAVQLLAYEHWKKTGDSDQEKNYYWATKEYDRLRRQNEQVLEKYAILTRKPSQQPGHVITMIAANHGRAAQGVVEFLRNQAALQELFQRMNLNQTDSLPDHFQVLFEVTVSKLNGEGAPETVRPIDHWVEPSSSSLLNLEMATKPPGRASSLVAAGQVVTA